MKVRLIIEVFNGWTANVKIHGTTRKIPTQVFKEEREQLNTLPDMECYNNSNIIRTVRKDNTIIYNSNRYSFPRGT